MNVSNPNTAAEKRFWIKSAETLFCETNSCPRGLSNADARARLISYGPNTISYHTRPSIWKNLVRRFSQPLVAILLVAAIAAGVTGDPVSSIIILVIVAVSVTLDMMQEYRAENASEALKKLVAIRCDVHRDNEVRSIPIEEVVPGDIVQLCAGDIIPADGIVVQGLGAHVNEALITGEPYPTEKREGFCNADIPADAFNALFSGSSVVSGAAAMLVVQTGNRTLFGGIAQALQPSERKSDFERGIDRLGIIIVRLTLFLVLLILLAHLLAGNPALQSFLFAIAIAVGLTPELLPMIATVTLSHGALRMSKKKVIVKRLAAIHDLGAMSVLCTDKTGTLTTASITLIAHPDVTGNDNADVRLLAAINSRFESGVKSPFDSAILASCDPASLQLYTKLAELPFDFERRAVSILARMDGAPLLITKGAPEAVLEKATYYQRGDGSVAELDSASRKQIQSIHDRFAKDGNRLLAIATKTMPTDCESTGLADEQELVFRGFCAFIDPPKESAATAIKRLIDYGIQIKVLSGDHHLVVRHVAEKLRIPVSGTLTGTQIDELSDTALIAAVREHDLFSRISPDQKTRIVRALQANRWIVGFIGDGVNDAPAIRNSDVGISVEAATDIARAAADFIMLDRDLTVLADGVEEGRKAFVNIVKYIRMGTSSNFGNMLSMALSSIFIPFLPLLPIQILLNNLIYDLSEIGIPFDRVGNAEIQKPQRWDFKKIIRFTFVMGSLSSCFDILTFALLLFFFAVPPELFRTAWFIESMATQILVIFFIRSTVFFSEPPAGILVLTSIVALAAALVMSLSPAAFIFGFTAVPPALLLAIAGIVTAYLLTVALTKKFAKKFSLF